MNCRSRSRFHLSVPAGVVLLGLVATACGAGSSELRGSGITAQGRQTRKVSGRIVSSRWLYAPVAPGKAAATMELDASKRLVTGLRGDRWLVDDRAGEAVAAPLLAPVPLVGVTRTPDGSFRFVGKDARIYESSSPLGPLRVHAPMGDGHLVSLSVRGRYALAAVDGRLLVSNDYLRSFRPVAWRGNVPLQVAVDGRGRCLVAAYPEQLWRSTDGGLHWQRLAVPAFGARWVQTGPEGTLYAKGQFRSLIWSRGAEPRLADIPLHRTEIPWLAAIPTPMVATWFAKGRASWDAGHVAAVWRAQGQSSLPGIRTTHEKSSSVGQILRPERNGSKESSVERTWVMAYGKVGRPVVPMNLARLESCEDLLVVSSSREPIVGCLRKANDDIVVSRLSLLDVAGPEPRLLDSGVTVRKRGSRLLRVGPEDLLIANACLEPDPIGCAPNTLVHLALRRGPEGLMSREKAEAILPRGMRLFGLPVVDPKSGQAFTLGKSLEDGSVGLLVSVAGGREFIKRKIVPLSGHPWRLDFGAGKLGVGPTGALSWLVKTNKGRRWVVVARDGKVLSDVSLERKGNLSVAGWYGLLVDEEGGVWESSDGGKGFQFVGQVSVDKSAPPVSCVAGGCAIGEGVVRVGWGEGEVGGLARRLVQQQLAAPRKGKTNTATAPSMFCRPVGPRHGFPSSLELRRYSGEPNLVDPTWVDWPEAFWASFWLDQARGRIYYGRVSRNHPDRFEFEKIVAGREEPRVRFCQSAYQVEGAAMLCFAPGVLDHSGKRWDELNVAWVHLNEGGVHRRRWSVPGLSGFWTRSRAKRAKKRAFLSIASGGIFVIPFAGIDAPGASVWFVPNQGPIRRVPIAPLPGPSSLDHLLLSAMFWNASGESFDTWSFHYPNHALFHARSSGRWTAFTFGPTTDRNVDSNEWNQYLRWTYGPGGQLAIGVQFAFGDVRNNRSFFLHLDPNRPVPPVSAAPVFAPNPAKWRFCTEQDYKSSTRLLTNFVAGAPPVALSAENSQQLLPITAAVLFGTQDSPCVSSLVASRKVGNTQQKIILSMTSPQRAWLVSRDSNQHTWQLLHCTPSFTPPR